MELHNTTFPGFVLTDQDGDWYEYRGMEILKRAGYFICINFPREYRCRTLEKAKQIIDNYKSKL